MSAISEFLTNEVYPRLDAVESGLLDRLQPKHSNGKFYHLNCPRCAGEGGNPEKNFRKAFYFTGASVIVCRRPHCSNTPLWEYLRDHESMDNGTIFRTLCAAAGVQPPDRESGTATTPQYTLKHAIKKITRDALAESAEAMQYLTKMRGFTDDQVRQMLVGFYPSEANIEKRLRAVNADLKLAQDWGLLRSEEQKRKKMKHRMENRLVWLSEQPDGSLRLWGRRLGEGDGPKYLFAEGTSKTIPLNYRAAGNKLMVAVEGALDFESLALLGIPSIGVGGAHVTVAQAQHLAEHGCRAILHLVDGDEAGLKGAVRTIANCEPLGIDVLIACVPDGADDVDKLRQQGRVDDILRLIEDAYTAGDFIAMQLVHLMTEPSRDYVTGASDIFRTIDCLGLTSQVAFYRRMSQLGVPLPTVKAVAYRTMAALMDVGIDEARAAKRVQDKYRVGLLVNENKESA